MSITTSTARSHGRSARRRAAGIASLAIVIAGVAGCSAAQEQLTAQQAPAPAPDLVRAAAGSDRHLENLAADVAVQARVARVAGSDRHLENLAADVAVQARVARAAGSDRHLENHAIDARLARAAGSDRHLENLAARVRSEQAPELVRWPVLPR